ncbi:MAG: ATP-dependent zinc metalloprotease FtsH [Deltaproteobacteria bacterium]|nr:ATP-dependent zinc metalloprotease FtsH [Deltaproteobacteria bacterium]MBI3386383.1 ATP-dependent zinc metalloprotease FtsH [Deltaproteobacteria bacterium]
MQKRIRFSIGYFIAAVAVLLLLNTYLVHEEVGEITYAQFKQLVASGKVTDVVISPDYITGRFTTTDLGDMLPEAQVRQIQHWGGTEHYFRTVRLEDGKLIELLDAQHVPYSGRLAATWVTNLMSWVGTVAFFLIVWGFVFRRMGAAGPGAGLMAIGKSKAKVYVESATQVTFADVAGVDEAKEELQEVVEFLKSPEKFRRLGGKLPKGVLLVGAPGTGKTLLARAVAGEAKVAFFSMSGSEFVEMFVGVGAARVRDLFEQAKQKAPCIVFIDELDALGKSRAINPLGTHDEREQTLNQLLVEMDGFDPNIGVIIMAATNRPEILDAALLRAGRFDRHVALDRPDVRGREAILRVHTRTVKLGPDVNLALVAGRTPGFVGADLANIVNEAALLAARRERSEVTMADFDDAIDRVVAGLERKTRVMNKREKEIVAYHESGHALVASALPGVDPVRKISIIPRGIAALGYTQQQPTEDRYLMTRSELEDRLCVLLGGRVAEEIVFGDISTGAQDDLQKATDIVLSMVTQYGMSEALGLRTFDRQRRSPFFDTPGLMTTKDYSEDKASSIDAEVEKILETAHSRVRGILTDWRALLERVAQHLITAEAIDGDELRRMIAEYREQSAVRSA